MQVFFLKNFRENESFFAGENKCFQRLDLSFFIHSYRSFHFSADARPDSERMLGPVLQIRPVRSVVNLGTVRTSA